MLSAALRFGRYTFFHPARPFRSGPNRFVPGTRLDPGSFFNRTCARDNTDVNPVSPMKPPQSIRLKGVLNRLSHRAVVYLIAWSLLAGPASAVAKTLNELLVELGYQSVKMELRENFWYVDAKLNGRARRALVDTGSSHCVVDKGVAGKFPRVGDPEIAGTAGIKRDVALIEKLEFGGVVFTNVAATVGELREPWEGRVPTGSNIAQRSSHDTILGKDFLERSHSVLHIGARMLYLRANAPSAAQTNLLAKTLAASGMTLVPFREVGWDGWVVSAKFNGHAATLLVDTGAFATGIDSTSAKPWGITGQHTKTGTFGINNRKGSSMITRVELLEVCECRLVKYPVGVSDLSQWGIGASSGLDQPIDGLLGNDVLSRANAILDCGSGRLWVIPKTISE